MAYGYDCRSLLLLETVSDRRLAQGADICRVVGKPVKTAPFLVKLMVMCGGQSQKHYVS